MKDIKDKIEKAEADVLRSENQAWSDKLILEELKHTRSLDEGEFEYEVKISNTIYETRTVRADTAEEAEEKIENDLRHNPHVEEHECDGATIEEVNEV